MGKRRTGVIFTAGTLFGLMLEWLYTWLFVTTWGYIWALLRFIVFKEAIGWVAIGLTVIFIDVVRYRKRHKKPPMFQGLRRRLTFLWLIRDCQKLADDIARWARMWNGQDKDILYGLNHQQMHIMSWRLEALGISSPTETDKVSLWHRFLVTLIGRVRSGRFDELADLWDSMGK
jgi:hypothetical protein